jgi:glycosyltransferase involved in cell wall biosynthesis
VIATVPWAEARTGPTIGSPAARDGRDDRVRVLHVLATLLPGGSEISVLRLVSALDTTRYRVSVACLRGEAPMADEFRAAGFEVVRFGMRGKLDPGCLLRLRRYVARERIDIVHTHMDLADFYGALAGRLGGARGVVATKHAPDEFRTRRTWKRYPFLLLERLAYEMDDAVIVVSEGLRAFLETEERLPRRKMVVIGHGIEAAPRPATRGEARRILGLPAQGPLIGAVGRLSHEKGQLVLLQALPAILAAFPRTSCVFAGEGPTRAPLEEVTRRLGIGDRVVFLGFRRDVPMVLAALDLFVQPSIYEGFGLSLLEAMAAGLPVVASRVGGIPEVIEDGRTGVLVPPQDPAALAGAVVRLLGDAGGARRLGETAAVSTRERYSLARVAERVDDLYRTILARPR